MRKFNELLILLAACATFMDFFYIPFNSKNGPLSPFIVPTLLCVLLLVAFLTSKKDIRLAFSKIIMGYCLYTAAFVGFMAPIFTLVIWAFSDNVDFSTGLSSFGYAAIIQVISGFAFALAGFISFKQWERLLART
ncbi:hypothetical protein [Alteromonas sp. KUL106]|uniref:hypothetical protein n=1 Tax=Alteromonas sp. KUL106 TaxID=2480799 RepID=UPI0012E69822|nr:hypothetical protein [Alteromonas sp. KUL106]GFD70542.1 hypothetical protein KUL106_38050 [Alteromonas sp. KUL106]